MCVVALSIDDASRLTEEICAQMYAANPAGAGIAWREEVQIEGKAKVVVRWEKGLNLAQFTELALSVPLPYLGHCRIPTCGGDTKVLTHPFPVSVKAPLSLSGQTTGYVLAHNGHWSGWDDKILGLAERTGIRIPGGAWSDTRAMAWATAVMGPFYLDHRIREKAILFGPKDFQIISPYRESWVRTTEGIVVSNLSWRHISQKGWTEVRGSKQTDQPADADKEDHSRTTNRIPSNGGSAQTGDTEVSGQDSKSTPHLNLRSPFAKGGRLIRRITPQEMAGFELMHRTKNRQGHPQISKKLLKKIRYAFEMQQKEDTRNELEARIKHAQENFARAIIYH
jgi:hypothetical protein